MRRLNQKGFHIVEVTIIVVVLLAIGFVGWRVMSGSKKQDDSKIVNTQGTATSNSSATTATSIIWNWDGSVWKPSSTAPTCSNPYKFAISPADVSLASSILYPGQTRGGNYKPHGGIRFDNNADNNVTVKLPADSILYEGSRYIEQGEIQYLLAFQTPCGIMYRFDHLLTLSDKFQKLVDATLPTAKVDDSRTTRFSNTTILKTGETVATAVGFTKTKNIGFDFGVYDLRQRNKSAANNSYVLEHQNFGSMAFYGVCWLDMLPGKDVAIVNALPAGDQANGKTSDYCK